MLLDFDVHATIPVTGLDEARKFYGETLGLEVIHEDLAGIIYKSGTGKLLVYKSEFAGSNKGTAASWEVDDVTGLVSALKDKGVQFEHYDNLTGVKRSGDIHALGDHGQVAWFKDPFGNILAVGSVM